MGHVDCVVWLKPPWSMQARDGQYSLVGGREQKSGYVRSLSTDVHVCMVHELVSVTQVM